MRGLERLIEFQVNTEDIENEELEIEEVERELKEGVEIA